MSLPVSVLVPRLGDRSKFWHRFARPAANRCGAGEVLTSHEPGGVAEKRNGLARRAAKEFLFFCDDDILLSGDCLLQLLPVLESSGAAYAYCDYIGIVHPGAHHPLGPVWTHRAGPWDHERLKRGNYISTMSLVRREAFEAAGGWDESLARFQDWDLWMTMAEQGCRGVHVPEVLFHAHYLPGSSITTDVDYEEARQRVREKHSL